MTFPWLGVDVKSSSAMRGVIRKNISLVMNGPFFQKENYNKYIIDRCNCVHVYGKMMIIVHDSHVFHSFYVKSQQTLHFSYVVFSPSYLPPLEMLMGCALGSLRMGPTLIQHFGMSQLQFGTLTTAFALAK